jgi:hypothetical protein
MQNEAFSIYEAATLVVSFITVMILGAGVIAAVRQLSQIKKVHRWELEWHKKVEVQKYLREKSKLDTSLVRLAFGSMYKSDTIPIHFIDAEIKKEKELGSGLITRI